MKTDFILQLDFYRRGDIHLFELMRNLLFRNVVRILPNQARKWIYKRKMREEVTGYGEVN